MERITLSHSILVNLTILFINIKVVEAFYSAYYWIHFKVGNTMFTISAGREGLILFLLTMIVFAIIVSSFTITMITWLLLAVMKK